MNPATDDASPVWDGERLHGRATQYLSRCQQWTTIQASSHDPSDPHARVDRLARVAAVEIGLAIAKWKPAQPAAAEHRGDAYGAAAVALVAIDESRQTWLDLVRRRLVRGPAAEPFVTDLVWLEFELERVFPGLRPARGRRADP